jgi:diaminopimelate epimerase
MTTELAFTKMNGAGNDFVMVDNRTLSLDLSNAQIAKICDRHRGIGSDGLLAVEPAVGQEADFRFRYYNADGGEVEMCGNGARCFARYVNRLHDFTLEKVSFETIAGLISAEFLGDTVRLQMSVPHGLFLKEKLPVNGRDLEVSFINTGVPHACVFVDDLTSVDVLGDGAALRYHERFAPKGTNANFIQVTGPQSLSIRTYERGVEGETQACGTGTVAAALLHHLINGGPSPIAVKVQGGETMTIGFEPQSDGTFAHVTLAGPGEFVFDGVIKL